MKVVIIDDNIKSSQELSKRLKKYDNIQVGGIAYNGFDGLELINNVHPDAVFLDVELPDISGLDFIDRSSYLNSSGCHVIIYTAYDKYVLPALRKRAFDVLLKPFDDSELDGIIKRLSEDDNKVVKSIKKNNDDPRYVLFTNSVDFTIISKGDIGLFQYDSPSRCWEAVVTGIDHPVKLRRNVKRENLLALGQQYVQVHQKYIIDTDYLLNVVDNHCTFFPPFDKIDYVTVGRVYREKLLEKFDSI